jgi:AcrR family transcriptional regulator
LFQTNVSNERMYDSHKTRIQILDVAEELFSEQGLGRVSIRDITRKAKVNLAAINYHFGSKQELIDAVFERRIIPVNEARLAALDEVERKAGKRHPKVEDILEAFIRPALQSSLQANNGSTAFSRLFGRCLSEPNPEVEALLRKQFEPLMERMDAALRKSLPHLSRPDVFWRMKFTFGALHHWLLTKDKCLPDWAGDVDIEKQTQKLISYAAAGLRAG